MRVLGLNAGSGSDLASVGNSRRRTPSWRMEVFASVREALLLSYGTNVIDAVEFSVLYDANSLRELFPYWKFDKFNFDDWDDTKCIVELRFAKADTFLLCRSFEISRQVCMFPDFAFF